MAKIADRVKKVDIDDEMKSAYLDYSMSVIVSRALPDVRDGLKPVHRRILYAMHDLGITPNKSHKKSARIVGEVLGKYHPHGDTAVYNSMVRMAQDFSYRYPLIDGHGNFGSVDGDSAAAMRYTEARMANIATDMLEDIGKGTIDFDSNFDDSLQEPSVLPAKVPNLLVNGSSGIAVGMSTSIPPHNLGEVVDGVIKLIDNPEVDIEELMKSIKGPDFPTGGYIMGKTSIYKAYKTGRGKIKLRAKTRIKEFDNGTSRIIIDELPYQVNKARLIEKIANLVKNDKIDGISDLRDESDRDGMRAVIELKRSATPKVVLNRLFKHTRMQVTFSMIMLALVDGQPETLNLKEILEHYLEHQKEVITRRTKYDLNKAEARAHILEGYKIALNNIDEIVEFIKNAPDVSTARKGLMDDYELTEKQANAILRMRLQSLTGLERDKIEKEYSTLKDKIKYFKSILNDENKLLDIIKKEILSIKEKYNDQRRTDILKAKYVDLEMEDLIEEQQIVVAMTNDDYIKRMPLDIYRSQKRGGKGVIGIKTKDEDFVEDVYTTSTHHYFLFFTNKGKVYRLKGYQIPEAGRQARGTPIINLLDLDKEERINSVIPVKEFDEKRNLIMATKNGLIKKTPLMAYKTNYTGLKGIKLRENDELIDVKFTNGDENIIIATHHGKAIHFNEEDVRETARSSFGVKAINLAKKDHIVGLGVDKEGDDLLVMTEKGYGKKTPLENYRLQTRGGKGLITLNVKEKNGLLSAIKIVNDDHEILIITKNGIMIRTNVNEISRTGRNTQGVKVMNLDKGDKVVSLARIEKPENTSEENKENENNKENEDNDEKKKNYEEEK